MVSEPTGEKYAHPCADVHMHTYTHTHTHTHTHQRNTTLVQLLSCVRSFVTLETTAHQIPLSMGFPRQDYWSGCHDPLQGIFLTQGLNPGLLHWHGFLTTESQMGKPILVGINLCLPVSFASYFYLFFFFKFESTNGIVWIHLII